MKIPINRNTSLRWIILVCGLTCMPISAAAQRTPTTMGVDNRLVEIVEEVEKRVSQIDQSRLRGSVSETERDLVARKRLRAIDKIRTAAFSRKPEVLRDAIEQFENIDSGETDIKISNIPDIYMEYAKSLELDETIANQKMRIEKFREQGSWLERYFAYRLSVQMHTDNSERQAALQMAQQALNIIPRDDDIYTRYAKGDITAVIAQLHNLQGNTDLAIEASLDYLRLTKDKVDAKTALDLINNLTYSHGINRDHQSSVFLSEKLLELESSETSDIPGLSEFRIAQAMNTSERFEKGLKFARQAISKSNHPSVSKGAIVMEATALAGLGRRHEAQAVAKENNINLSSEYLLNQETGRDRLYLGYLLAQGENDALALQLYNRQLDITAQKLLSASARDTTSMLAALENTRERQEERAAAAAREAALLELTIVKQRKLNRMLMTLLGFAALALIGMLAFMRFRERILKALAIKTEQAASADKLKTEFLGLISHELRTPLNGIIGFSDLLAQTHSDPDVRKKTSVILQSGHELLEVVESMTDMARIDAGQMNIVPDTFDVSELLSEAVEPFQEKAETKAIAFTHHIAPDLAEHMVDGPRLQQCVRTLLSNAVSFTEKGRVHVHVTSQKDEVGAVNGVTVIVADTGMGMTELVQSRLFTPFMQADTSLRRSHMGTGLSLAIAKALAELMGGTLSVVSRRGRGSEFTLIVPLEAPEMAVDDAAAVHDSVADISAADEMPTPLPPTVLDLMQPQAGRETAPLHAAPPTDVTPDDRVAHNLDGLRVLIVDALHTDREVIREMLENEGCICFDVPNGQDAMTALQSGSVDVVILNIHQTHLDGVETTRMIRNSRAPYAEIPIVALTADEAAATNAAGMAAGIDIFLTKPVKRSDLCPALAFLQTEASRRAPLQNGVGRQRQSA